MQIRPTIHSDRHATCRRQQTRQSRIQSRGKNLFRFACYLLQVFRYGEALHPGPPCQGFVLGLLNPTGLLTKAELINQLPQGTHGTTWVVSETHLTQNGCSQFKKALHLTKSPYKLVHGDYVPPKYCQQSKLAVRGKERGVGFLTTTPSRSLMHDWPHHVAQQQRCHVAGIQMGHHWVQGGAFYGNAFQSTGANTRDHNNDLLSFVVNRLCEGARGPRFIGGDFNHFIDDLPVVQTLLQQGWEEVQHAARRKFGQEIAPTIQQKHTKDLLFLSPDLTPLIRSVHVEADWVANHSIVYVVLDPHTPPQKVPIWKQPRPVEWPQEDSDPDLLIDVPSCPSSQLTAEQQYRTIWQTFEAHKVHQAKQCGQNIHGSQTGRGSTVERTWIHQDFVPLRPTRPGGFTPSFHGQSNIHTHWIKQLRRLQALAQMHHANHVPSPTWIERKIGQWRAIKRAAGFRPSFAQWWNSKAKHLYALPSDLPVCPPDGDLARLLALDFQQDVCQLEQMLTKSRIDKAKQARLDNPARIFVDLQKPRSEPVQMLLAHQVATIDLIDHDESAVVLDSANAFEASRPIEHNGIPLSIIHHDTDKIWLEHMPPLQEGDTLTQTTPILDLEDIYTAFQKEWMARWDRHANTLDSAWEPIVEFVQHAFPAPPSLEYKPITYDVWLAAVRKKKYKAAVGPDGVSRSDLLALPPSSVSRILELLTAIEEGHSMWPRQVVTGHVHALEKTPSAWHACQYRPLTVFSIVYRTWSSIRAKETLAYLSRFVSAQVTGNIPGKSCTDLWLGIQMQLEDATNEQQPMAGVVADLVKAYNLLPRMPLLAIGLHLGLPKPIIRAWANALTQLTRAFSVRGTVGPPLHSSTGFAEGCGLSCTAMLLCNITLARWLYYRLPSVKLWSYVDNLELTAKSITDASRGLDLMTQFCALMDLQIDEAKTYFWSNDAAERAGARHAQLPLQYSARDLGAHMEYGRRLTNHVLRVRLATMPRIWDALARSPAPYRQKVHAVRVKGWPQALSAGLSAPLGDTHIRTLRTGACRGLRVHAPGISPMVHLSLIEHPLTDPGCHLLIATVQAFRRHADLDQACRMLDILAFDHTDMPPKPGPCHVLLSRLHHIGWQWIGHGWVADQEGVPLDLLHGAQAEVQQRLLSGWQQFVQLSVSRRKTFQGMEWAHAPFTMEKVATLPREKLGLMRKALNGSFFTADTQLHNKKAHSLVCKFCGEEDSQFHRFWECKQFHTVRPHPWLVTKVLAGGLPKCLTYHGWIGLPTSVRALQRALVRQQDKTDQFDFPPFTPVDLFVDGSCLNPTCAFTRVAGWGLVAANPADMSSWWPLAQGPVPGHRQTSLRAEITAAISALKYVTRTGQPVRLWVDNAQVVDTLTQALRCPETCTYSRNDQDLWSSLLALARLAPQDRLVVHKVASHQNPDKADLVERWAFSGNNGADHSAWWNTRYSEEVPQLWRQATLDLDAAKVLRDQVHQTILQVSEAAVKQESHSADNEPAEVAFPLPLQEVTMGTLPIRPQTSNDKLIGSHWPMLTQWASSLLQPSATVVFIPWFYLYIDFVLETNLGGPKPSHRYSRWQWMPRCEAAELDLFLRTKWFRLLLIKVYKNEGIPLSSQYVRPSTRTIMFWAHSVSCRMQSGRLQRVDAFLSRFRAAFSKGSDLASVSI